MAPIIKIIISFVIFVRSNRYVFVFIIQSFCIIVSTIKIQSNRINFEISPLIISLQNQNRLNRIQFNCMTVGTLRQCISWFVLFVHWYITLDFLFIHINIFFLKMMAFLISMWANVSTNNNQTEIVSNFLMYLKAIPIMFYVRSAW